MKNIKFLSAMNTCLFNLIIIYFYLKITLYLKKKKYLREHKQVIII